MKVKFRYSWTDSEFEITNAEKLITKLLEEASVNEGAIERTEEKLSALLYFVGYLADSLLDIGAIDLDGVIDKLPSSGLEIKEQ